MGLPQWQSLICNRPPALLVKAVGAKRKPSSIDEGSFARRQSESNRCIVVLQTSPLPLGYDALSGNNLSVNDGSVNRKFV